MFYVKFRALSFKVTKFRLFSSCSHCYFIKNLNNQLLKVEPREHVIKHLDQPVGSITPPFQITKYKNGNSFKDMFDRNNTSKRVQELTQELGKSGLYELHRFRKTNGKLFLSPRDVWSADLARYFPHLVGTSPNGESKRNVEDEFKNKLSVVRLAGCKAGEELVATYFQQHEKGVDYLQDNAALQRDTGSRDGRSVQIVDIVLSDGWLKTALTRLSFSTLSGIHSLGSHVLKFLCNRKQLPFLVLQEMAIENPYTGYVLVVDDKARIRWIACGHAGKDGFAELWKAVRTVQREQTGTA